MPTKFTVAAFTAHKFTLPQVHPPSQLPPRSLRTPRHSPERWEFQISPPPLPPVCLKFIHIPSSHLDPSAHLATPHGAGNSKSRRRHCRRSASSSSTFPAPTSTPPHTSPLPTALGIPNLAAAIAAVCLKFIHLPSSHLDPSAHLATPHSAGNSKSRRRHCRPVFKLSRGREKQGDSLRISRSGTARGREKTGQA
ncbi:hypothetical protein PAHAL_7G026400 [Panicum hallii]|uniref:Uncharacterized protein n=1 Tax=Panicum hallii TaxID=206008 RepID=A0A2T8IAS2_9POAL|nr:hypothetical protein PAHAL_7G026400 [Panicum hallii]